MAIFTKLNGSGNQTFRGQNNIYDQVDYDGVITDYTFTLNADSSVTVFHPEFGTDTLHSIEGFWFIGSSTWVSMEDALVQSASQPATPPSTPPGTDPFQIGTDGNDTMIGSNVDNVFLGDAGNDFIDGNGGTYNQANYFGALSDVNMTLNADGSITVVGVNSGTDTLVDIDGFWFGGEEMWYSTAEALEIAGGTEPVDPSPVDPGPVDPGPIDPGPVDPGPTGPSGGTFVDGVYTGTSGVDALVGGMDATTFNAGMGVGDTIIGNSNADSLNVEGGVVEWTFFNNADGSVTMTHPTWGSNTLTGIDSILFGRTGQTLSVADAIAATAGLPAFRLDDDGVVNGTPFDDVMIGTDGFDNYYGGVGNDVYDGGAGFDQVNYDGLRSDYAIVDNGDGTITINNDVFGTDTISNIEGIFFNGGANDIPVEGINIGEPEFILVSDLFGAA